MEEGNNKISHRGGKPDHFRGRGGKRIHGPRDGGGRGPRHGGFGMRSGRAEKRGKLQMDVCPQHLRFTQDSIANKFKPPFDHLYIDVAVEQIRQKLLSPARMTPLNVVKHKGILWSLDNRGLWVFRKAQVEEIRVNLVSINYSPRSSEFFSSLNAEMEKIYSNPLYYPHVRGKLGNISYLDHSDDLEITGAEPTLSSFSTSSPEQKVIPKYTRSELISIRIDAGKEDSLYVPIPGLERILGILFCPETTGGGNVSSFPQLSPEPIVMPSMNVVSNPKTTLNDHQNLHKHIVEISNDDPNVPLLSSEEEAVSENMVIRFMKKLFHGLRFGTMKVCAFWYHKVLQGPYKLLHGMFRRR